MFIVTLTLANMVRKCTAQTKSAASCKGLYVAQNAADSNAPSDFDILKLRILGQPGSQEFPKLPVINNGILVIATREDVYLYIGFANEARYWFVVFLKFP